MSINKAKSTNFVLVNLTIHDQQYAALIEPHWTLTHVLRNVLGLTGTKESCNQGACGSCTVLLDGVAAPSCMLLAIEQEEKKISTIEGLSSGETLHPIQEAWLEEYGSQCGFCSPGMIMSSKALLDQNPKPSQLEIKEALSGNICICSNYEHIFKAVTTGSRKLAKE